MTPAEILDGCNHCDLPGLVCRACAARAVVRERQECRGIAERMARACATPMRPPRSEAQTCDHIAIMIGARSMSRAKNRRSR